MRSDLPDSSSAFSAILVHVTRPGGRVVIIGSSVVGFFAVVDDGVVRLGAGTVDDAGVVDAGRFVVLAIVVDDEDVECSGVVLLSTKWLKSVGGTVAICAVGLGRGRGDFVVSTYEAVTNGSAVVVVMFGFWVASTVNRVCVVMMVVRRWGRSVVGDGRREVVVRWIGRFVLVDMGFLLAAVVILVVVVDDGVDVGEDDDGADEDDDEGDDEDVEINIGRVT